MDGVTGILGGGLKRREKVVGIFSLPLKQATTWPTLDNQNHQYFGPAWGSFFCRRKSSLDSNSFGQSPSPTRSEKGASREARRWVPCDMGIFWDSLDISRCLLSAQVSTLNAWLGGMSWLLHHVARKLGGFALFVFSRLKNWKAQLNVSDSGWTSSTPGIHTFIHSSC